MVISSPKHTRVYSPRVYYHVFVAHAVITTRVYSPFTFVLSENVFCQGMVVLLNPVCVLLSGMLHVYKSDVRVAVFET